MTRLPFDPVAPEATLDRCEAAIHAFFPHVPEITARHLAARLRPGPPILLDVRTDEEHAISHLPGARPVPPDMPAARILTAAEFASGTPIVLACSVGLRSGRLADALLRHGLPPTRVLNLRGGLFRWARLGLPMVDTHGPTQRVHPFDPSWARLLQA